MADEPEVLYRFTPQFEGAFLRNVPQRDLTQKDVDHMTGVERRDAFSPHPVYGTPLYTAVEGTGARNYWDVHNAPEPVIEASEPVVVEVEIYPKWFLDKQERAHADGNVIPIPVKGETQKAYEERVGPQMEGDE